MKSSTIAWHLARDNQIKLSHFCDKHQVDRQVSPYYKHKGDDANYFSMMTYFDNGGFITAEMKQGSTINEDYQVINYSLGEA